MCKDDKRMKTIIIKYDIKELKLITYYIIRENNNRSQLPNLN